MYQPPHPKCTKKPQNVPKNPQKMYLKKHPYYPPKCTKKNPGGFFWYILAGGRGYKTTPKWGIKPPPTPFLAIFDPWGGFMPPGGGFIPPFAGVGLSPHRGGFIPRFGHWGGFITPLGWFYPPFLVILSPYWPGGGGLADLNVNQETQSRKTDRRTVHSSACFALDCFALLCCVLPPPPRA